MNKLPCVDCGEVIYSSNFKIYMCDDCFERRYYPEGRNDN
jgi:formylmethanofuran dehydrogenase subunit E